MNNVSSKGRASLLLSVGTAMAVAMIATGAQAAETDVTPSVAPPPPVATGLTNDAHDIITTVQEKILTTNAAVTDSVGGVDTTDADDTNDPADATAVLVDSNSKTATATANTFTSTIDVAVVPPVGQVDDGDGAAAVGVQINLGAVSAFAGDGEDGDDAGDQIHALLQDFSVGTAVVTNNSITANATGNSGSTLLHGSVLPEYASDAEGSSVLTFGTPADWLDATGGLLSSTLQIQSDQDAPISDTATASENSIDLAILNTVDDASVDGSATLGGNKIAANVAGNSSNSTIDIQGGAPTLIGTAVVTNGQINVSTESVGNINATNEDSDVIATVAADDVNTTDDAEFQGKLAVSGNAITSNASGNQALGAAQGEAGNRILLANGMSYQGTGGDYIPGADLAYDAGTLDVTVGADLIIDNSQGNVGAGDEGRMTITGSTDDGEIAAVVDDINGGSVAVSGNQITGTASGNAASSAFASGDNMASFAGSVAVSNQQNDYFADVLAEGTGDIYAAVSDDDDVPDSTVTVAGNTVGATAYGNSVSQSLSLDAVAQTLPLSGVSLTGGTGPDGNVSSEGSLTVTNLQANYNSSVAAREVHNIYAQVSDEGDTVDHSGVSVTGNTGEAVAVGSSAANSLSLAGGTDDGDTVSGGAGIASVQILDDSGAEDQAAIDVSASSTGIAQIASPEVDSSNLTLSGNLQRGVAYGGLATNTLGVSGTVTTIDGTENDTASVVTYDEGAVNGLVLTNSDLPEVDAAHGLLNVQSLNGDVAAEALPAYWTDLDSSFAITIDGDVDGGTIVNGGHIDADTGLPVGGNTLVAAAYGADATNAASLDVGNLGTSNDNFASVMNVTNVQEVTASSSVTAQASGGAAISTVVTGDNDIDGSSVSTSYNTVQALAYGNRAANSLSATGNSIDTEADPFPTGIRGEAGIEGDEAGTDASFTINNVQAAGGDIVASLLDDPEDPDTSVAVVTAIGDDVIDSSVASDGNTLSAGATANRANNSLDVTGNGLATTSAITNFQTDPSNISALVGIEGSGPTPFIPGQPDDPFGFDVTGSGLSHTGSAFTSGTLFVDDTTLTPDEIAYLETQGWSPDGPDTLSRDATGYAATAGEYADLSEGGSMERADTVPATPDTPATPGSPNIGGVVVAIGGDIDPSSVSVSHNMVSGSVTGNSADNALKVTGNDVEDGSDHLLTYAIADGPDLQADGDHMVANVQVVGEGSDLSSDVYNTFAIDTDDGVDIVGATLTVDHNSQSSRAVANTANNSVELDANTTAAGAVLASSQASAGTVEATSNADIYAPAASSGSSVSMSGNSNLAIAAVNDVTNTLTVDTTNDDPVSFPIDAIGAVGGVLGGVVTFGDHVLQNEQLATTSADATAVTTIYNQDVADPATAGIDTGSITVSGNSTTAQATANFAANTANVSASASMGAAAGLTNAQESSANVTASATTSAGIALAGDATIPAAALNGGSVTVGGNTTSALARGNAANNALNYSAGADYGTPAAFPSGATLPIGGGGSDTFVAARAVVLNVQDNSGAVSASSTDATYFVALNTADGPSITNGTVGVIGNSVSAAAYGNTASNSLALNSVNTGMPTAVLANYQTNSGPVTATVTTVSYGVNSGFGAITGSSLAVTGNSVTATAVGNNAVSTIAAVH